MASCSCNHHFNLSLKFRTSFRPLCNLSHVLPPKRLNFQLRSSSITSCTDNLITASSGCGSFTWNDVNFHSQIFSPDLQGFIDRVKSCNRGSENLGDFIPFVIENQVVGYVHDGFAEHLRKFPGTFIFSGDNSQNSHFGDHVRLHPMLTTPKDRTRAVGDVVKCLGEDLIPGIRNEHYPVLSSFGTPEFFSLERAAAAYFGIKAYGVHMNGYVERDGQKYLWIGKRSESKPTYPGMLDHIVAGGLPYGISCGENVVKECEEEAGIPRSIANQAIPVGVVSYMDIEGYRYKRDVLFCYDLKLPESFIPTNQDGEVGSFKLIPATVVANVIQRTEFFKPNCNLVIIDFLFRHGYITPDNFGYLELLHSLRRVACS